MFLDVKNSVQQEFCHASDETWQEKWLQMFNNVLPEEGEIILENGRHVLCIKCPICGKMFHGAQRRYRLERHNLIHTGEKPYPCPFCPYRANVRENMLRHVKILHPEQQNSPSLNK